MHLPVVHLRLEIGAQNTMWKDHPTSYSHDCRCRTLIHNCISHYNGFSSASVINLAPENAMQSKPSDKRSPQCVGTDTLLQRSERILDPLPNQLRRQTHNAHDCSFFPPSFIRRGRRDAERANRPQERFGFARLHHLNLPESLEEHRDHRCAERADEEEGSIACIRRESGAKCAGWETPSFIRLRFRRGCEGRWGMLLEQHDVPSDAF